jgi:predicted dithiol-disulfide oxidoreductase (DUF899 family)
MSFKFPGESDEYRAARDRLLEAEVDLRRSIENVAAQRRELPSGGAVPEDYVFEEAMPGDGAVRMSELFAPGKDGLVIYSFMFPRNPHDERPGPAAGNTARLPVAETPCASCTSILDSLDRAAPHLVRRVNLAIVAKSSPDRIRAFAQEREWDHLRLLSSSGNTYNRDYFGEDEDGQQMPMLNVFVRDDGTIRHFWGSELMSAETEPALEPRHVDLIWPLWNALDLLPEGRGTDPDFPQFVYD